MTVHGQTVDRLAVKLIDNSSHRRNDAVAEIDFEVVRRIGSMDRKGSALLLKQVYDMHVAASSVWKYELDTLALDNVEIDAPLLVHHG